VLLVIGVSLFLQKTKLGKAIRALGNDPELAKILGIDSDNIILGTFAVGSLLAGVAGILVSLDIDMNPAMGMNALLAAVVSAIIGGIGNIPGIILGALLLSFSQQLVSWQISSQWQNAIAFAILLGFLIYRPQGFLGRATKKATV
jgi:branched-chain amino acid transport system permease protein